MAKVIAIVNQKGGVGKTTTAINLSTCVAERNKKVLLVDLDPQGNATSGISVTIEEGKTVYEVLIKDSSFADIIKPTMVKKLSVAPSNIDLAGAEVELVSMEQREFRFKKAIDAIREDYDYIFIDCPPSLGLLTVNALTGADSVLVPIQCEYYALEGLGQLVDTINLIKSGLNPNLEIEGVVLTMYDNRTRLSNQVANEIKKYFGEKTFDTEIPRNVRLSEAPSYGLPITVYDPLSKGARTYKKLAKELVERNK